FMIDDIPFLISQVNHGLVVAIVDKLPGQQFHDVLNDLQVTDPQSQKGSGQSWSGATCFAVARLVVERAAADPADGQNQSFSHTRLDAVLGDKQAQAPL